MSGEAFLKSWLCALICCLRQRRFVASNVVHSMKYWAWSNHVSGVSQVCHVGVFKTWPPKPPLLRSHRSRPGGQFTFWKIIYLEKLGVRCHSRMPMEAPKGITQKRKKFLQGIITDEQETLSVGVLECFLFGGFSFVNFDFNCGRWLDKASPETKPAYGDIGSETTESSVELKMLLS